MHSIKGGGLPGVFAKVDIRGGMPMGVLLSRPCFRIEFLEKRQSTGSAFMDACPCPCPFMVLDSTDAQGTPLNPSENPCAFISATSRDKRKRSNVVIRHVHPGVAVYYAGPRGIKKHSELLVKGHAW